jgi:lipid-binding SYLF domain-containing protein
MPAYNRVTALKERPMKNVTKLIPLLVLVICAASTSWAASDAKDKAEAEKQLQRAATVLGDLAKAPDQGIPDRVFESAKCIAVVPNLTKGGFILGAQHGRGVATCRMPNGGWSAPALFTITGGSWGAQIGVEDVHLVLMIMNDQGMQHLLSNKFQVGGEASAAAGPVGRAAAAGTDWKADTEMLTYSRSKGIFAGIDLGGSWIEPDKELTEAFYGKDLSPREVLTGRVPAPASARVFLDEVSRVKHEASEAKEDR